MNPLLANDQRWDILADADRCSAPSANLFDAEAWRAAGAVTGEAPGRGSALFVDGEQGPAVLRQYLRGGWMARLSRDRYLFTGLERSRPFSEFRLLAGLVDAGLPVPSPIAAGVLRKGPFYRGALLTVRIPQSEALADRLGEQWSADPMWSEVGQCIRRFHEAGAWHSDLNARNILLNESGVWLLDFDRGRFTPGRAVDGEGNLRRLRRSLEKLWPGTDQPGLEEAWNRLRQSYGD